MVLLTVGILGLTLTYPNTSHADTTSSGKVTQETSSVVQSTNYPWGDGLSITLDDNGTLHLPSGKINNPRIFTDTFGGFTVSNCRR